MGTDIHCCIERRNATGAWEVVELPPELRSPWYVEQSGKSPDDGWYATHMRYQPYDGRNYDLFAVLADVRNGSGFAGCVTGERITPISEPRGFPEDLSPTVRAWAEDRDDLSDEERDAMLWMGDHSFSWVTLAELLAYPWDSPHVKVGVIPLDKFAKRVAASDDSQPSDWCGWISGQKIVVFQDAEARAQLASGGIVAPEGAEVHVQTSWTQPLATHSGDFVTRVVAGMKTLHPDPNCVRLVFGFDS